MLTFVSMTGQALKGDAKAINMIERKGERMYREGSVLD